MPALITALLCPLYIFCHALSPTLSTPRCPHMTITISPTHDPSHSRPPSHVPSTLPSTRLPAYIPSYLPAPIRTPFLFHSKCSPVPLSVPTPTSPHPLHVPCLSAPYFPYHQFPLNAPAYPIWPPPPLPLTHTPSGPPTHPSSPCIPYLASGHRLLVRSCISPPWTHPHTPQGGRRYGQ